jgi:hypothetical protein
MNPAGIPKEINSHFPSAVTLPSDNISIIHILRLKATERHVAVTSLQNGQENRTVLEGQLDSKMDVRKGPA